MKLKGERELLAEEMYSNIESELNILIREKSEKLKSEDIDEVYKTVSSMHTYLQTADALITGDFKLEEIRVLYKYSEEKCIVKILSEIIEGTKGEVNVNNLNSLVNFIKIMLLLKVKDRELALSV